MQRMSRDKTLHTENKNIHLKCSWNCFEKKVTYDGEHQI